MQYYYATKYNGSHPALILLVKSTVISYNTINALSMFDRIQS